MGLLLLVEEGAIRRSVCDVSCWPTISGQYAARPSCGASLGVASSPSKNNRVSLGGYVKLLFPGQCQWVWCGLTCHHLLEKITRNNLVDQDLCRGTESDIQELTQHTAHATEIQSPHQVDFDNTLSRLRERRDLCEQDEKYAELDTVPMDQITTLEAANLGFGSVKDSSGLCIHDRLQMQV